MNLSNNNLSNDEYEYHDYYLPQRIGPGALANDQVRRCYKCNKPIAFRKRPDGSWQLMDYFTGQRHIHKDRKEE